MLLAFCIKNFRSIVNTAVDMRLHNEAISAAPCLGMYGANASGKSNIMDAISLLRDIIVKRTIDSSYFPNKIQHQEPFSSFELDFAIEQNIYSYSLMYDGLSIVGEALSCDGECLYHITSEMLDFSAIERDNYSAQKLEAILDVECKDGRGQRAAFLSVAGRNYAGLNAKLTQAFHYISEQIITYQYSASNTIDKIQAVSDIIKKLDISINSMAAEQGSIYTYHTSIDGKEIRFELDEESLGTQIMTRMLGTILAALETGSVILADELDASLHPLLLQEVIKLFKDERYNTKGAQLIFTAHNTNILEELISAAEFGIVTKTQKKGTTLARAIDYDIADGMSLQKAYLNGELGGIPFPYI
ncbi:MAG: AAA family ATPase [Deferribacteraceae bacterium]|jgi:AAA15 family ATPase/GTPase|nr:AAA family ATPase [Deferribacteraceae bacterium]